MPASDPATPSAALREHCLYCFDVLHAKLSGDPEPDAPFEDTGDEYPLFVTWNTVSTSGKTRLRGCIGTFAPRPLKEGLADFALTSALEDHRFDPISSKELPSLECGVSLLTDFEDCSSYLDWTPGVHGIYIHLTPPPSSFSSRRSILTATFLPDVIPAQDWTRVEAIDAAIRKSGWRGGVDDELRRGLRVQRYQSAKVEVRYGEWKEWREKRGGVVVGPR